MDLVYLQHDHSFCAGKTVSSPSASVAFVLRPYFKAAGFLLQIEPKPGGEENNPKTSIMSHVALETLNINMQ